MCDKQKMGTHSREGKMAIYSHNKTNLGIWLCTIWGPNLSSMNIKKLQRVQRFGLILMTGASPTTPTTALETLMNITPVELCIKMSAIRAFARIAKVNKEKWNGHGDGDGDGTRNGHIKVIKDWTNEMNIDINYEKKISIFIANECQEKSEKLSTSNFHLYMSILCNLNMLCVIMVIE